jgi:hypothetical protein
MNVCIYLYVRLYILKISYVTIISDEKLKLINWENIIIKDDLCNNLLYKMKNLLKDRDIYIIIKKNSTKQFDDQYSILVKLKNLSYSNLIVHYISMILYYKLMNY